MVQNQPSPFCNVKTSIRSSDKLSSFSLSARLGHRIATGEGMEQTLQVLK